MDISLYTDGEQATASVLNRPLNQIKGAVDSLENNLSSEEINRISHTPLVCMNSNQENGTNTNVTAYDIDGSYIFNESVKNLLNARGNLAGYGSPYASHFEVRQIPVITGYMNTIDTDSSYMMFNDRTKEEAQSDIDEAVALNALMGETSQHFSSSYNIVSVRQKDVFTRTTYMMYFDGHHRPYYGNTFAVYCKVKKGSWNAFGASLNVDNCGEWTLIQRHYNSSSHPIEYMHQDWSKNDTSIDSAVDDEILFALPSSIPGVIDFNKIGKKLGRLSCVNPAIGAGSRTEMHRGNGIFGAEQQKAYDLSYLISDYQDTAEDATLTKNIVE